MRHEKLNLRALLAVLAIAASGAVHAQEPATPAEPPPAGSLEVVPEKIQPRTPANGQDNLTDQLAPTGGVINPAQQVDPGMVAPPPDGGAAVTPVIPPPAPESQPN